MGVGIVAEEADHEVQFVGHATLLGNMSTTSLSSLLTEAEADPFNFSVYMDQAPLTVMTNSPLELVQQMFVKLGARYVVVTDSDGYCAYLASVRVCVLVRC